MNNLGALNIYFTGTDLKAGILVSLLSVSVLIGVFSYLTRYTKRHYFLIWTVAWLFYALWLTLNFRMEPASTNGFMAMAKQWCISVAAVFLLWGSVRFLGQRARESQLAWFIAFLLAWSYIGAYHLNDALQIYLPIFALIGVASLITAYGFFTYRRKRQHIGASSLGFGFFFWGCYLASYPFLQTSEELRVTGFFLSTVVQLFIAVSMIILVLEQLRFLHQRQSIQEIRRQERQKASLQMKVISTEERYRNLFDQASEAIVIVAANDLRILELNHAAEYLLGITRAEAHDQPLSAFCRVDAEKPPANTEEWFVLLRHRALSLMRKNGSVVATEPSGASIDFDGVPAYQFFFREVTERSRLEQQLRHAEKLSSLGQMISCVAHELNNPLAVIKGYLELILAHHELPAQTRADLQQVAQESTRAAKLVQNFLGYARERVPRREMVRLNRLIERAIELRQFDFDAAKAEPLLALDPMLPHVYADADQVQQVLVILITNALQSLSEVGRRGVVKISTEQRGETVRVLVEDNGPGVPKHLEEKIFEPFYTTKQVGKGTGLGLSLAHSILSEHHGRIFCQKSSLGGAGMVLELPVAAVSAEAAVPATEIVERRHGFGHPRSAKILVLDDARPLGEMLGEMLTLLGFKATVCHTALDALELIGEQNFDLIFSDMRMPGIDGQEFYKLATQKKPQLATRIVFLSGDMISEETKAFLETIDNPLVAKPFQLANIETVLEKMLDVDAAA